MNIKLNNTMEKECAIVGKDVIGHPMILAGKMKRPDTLHWSGYDDGTHVVVSGLWRSRPRYGEVVVRSVELLDAFIQGGFAEDAKNLQSAMKAWNVI